MSIPASTPLLVVLEGIGGDISSGVVSLGGGIKATLGGGSVSRRGGGLMDDATLKLAGAGLSLGAGR